MKTLAGVVLLGLAVAAPVQAAVKDAQPNGFTLENSEWVPVAPQVAYAALVNDVGRWWPADHTWWGDASKLSRSATRSAAASARSTARSRPGT